MPELPEVETVRAGLQRFVTDRVVAGVEVRHSRSVRRHIGGAADFQDRLAGRMLLAPRRRGKFIWVPLGGQPDAAGGSADEPAGDCLIAHLGMSGQLLVQPSDAPEEKHLHVRFRFADGGPELRFVDQRTFGGMLLDDLVDTPDRPGDTVPAQVAHVARDPLDPAFDDAAFLTRLRAKRTVVKRALLDQTLVSGIGNIYADESLWRARLSGEHPTGTLPRRRAGELLACVRAVLTDALAAGGTSFDALYVNVNGMSGYFDRSLAVYGQQGRPCPRCGTPVARASFMNRSSFFCPRCQRPPRPATTTG